MTRAEQVVGQLLETDWDKALETYRNLSAQRREADRLFKELGRSILYHRALIKAGVRKEDVARPLVGGQIGATHNYKGTHKVKRCTNPDCTRRSLLRTLPPEAEQCPECQQPVAEVGERIAPTHLRTKYDKTIVGVELNDGSHVWFDEPLVEKF